MKSVKQKKAVKLEKNPYICRVIFHWVGYGGLSQWIECFFNRKVLVEKSSLTSLDVLFWWVLFADGDLYHRIHPPWNARTTAPPFEEFIHMFAMGRFSESASMAGRPRKSNFLWTPLHSLRGKTVGTWENWSAGRTLLVSGRVTSWRSSTYRPPIKGNPLQKTRA